MERILERCKECAHAKWEGEDCLGCKKNRLLKHTDPTPIRKIAFTANKKRETKTCIVCKNKFKARTYSDRACTTFCRLILNNCVSTEEGLKLTDSARKRLEQVL